MTITSPKRIGALALVAAIAVAACGGGATEAPASGEPGASQPAGGVSGSIVVSGSSTVEPISTGVAELFKQQNPDWNYQIEGPGTGDGFARFCNGETDISDASRAIKDEEAEKCKAAGIEYVELKVAYDGLSVVTNVNNTAIACLSFSDIYALVGPESTGFTKWSDGTAIAKELGSSTTLPEADLVITGPGEESGTYDSFVELVIAKIAESRGQEAQTRPDYTSSGNDNVIVEGISGNPTSLGWVGLAFAEESADKIRLGRPRLRRGERGQDPRDPGQQGRQRHLRGAQRPDGLRRQLPDLPAAVHLREQGQGRRERGRQRLRRLLPRRGDDRQGPRDRAVREPPGRGARRDAGRLGSALASRP
ncbi:MAG: substrate-binding domain-containing protein, partial [Chloroflexi bacterium]|nr:substrate-binding domain-containing protein [Chloroflexota bacterium]